MVTSAPASNLYGCVSSTDRTLRNVYTNEANYLAFLKAHGGKCPDGFPITIKSATDPVVPPVDPGKARFTLSTLDHAQTPNMGELTAGSNDGGAVVRQEVWNPDTALRKQLTEVWSPSHWRTTINAADGNTAVNSYPDVSSLVTTSEDTPVPFANYATINSSWSVDCHANPKTNAQATYDIWLNDYDIELMIWVDTHGANLGREPAGFDTGTVMTFDSVDYQLWREPDNSVLSLVRKVNAPVGSIDLRKVILALIGGHYLPATVGVNMFTFGFETPSTGGVDEVFEVNAYTLKTTAVTGKVI